MTKVAFSNPAWVKPTLAMPAFVKQSQHGFEFRVLLRKVKLGKRFKIRCVGPGRKDCLLNGLLKYGPLMVGDFAEEFTISLKHHL
ncbi:hypothetical protein NDI52_25755 [Leptolyngbya sp. PL-A3]|nr:hypothetical protein [Leptolyngbya sp. FACHB-8]